MPAKISTQVQSRLPTRYASLIKGDAKRTWKLEEGGGSKSVAGEGSAEAIWSLCA